MSFSDALKDYTVQLNIFLCSYTYQIPIIAGLLQVGQSASGKWPLSISDASVTSHNLPIEPTRSQLAIVDMGVSAVMEKVWYFLVKFDRYTDEHKNKIRK